MGFVVCFLLKLFLSSESAETDYLTPMHHVKGGFSQAWLQRNQAQILGTNDVNLDEFGTDVPHWASAQNCENLLPPVLDLRKREVKEALMAPINNEIRVQDVEFGAARVKHSLEMLICAHREMKALNVCTKFVTSN